MSLWNAVCSTGSAGASELATVLVVWEERTTAIKKQAILILKMSMNKAFIWLSGHRFIDREIFNG